MNLRRNKKAQALIETLIALPIFFLILFFLLEFSFLTIAQRIHQWACFRMARSLLPQKVTGTFFEKSASHFLAHNILQKIPFSKTPPLIISNVSDKEITVAISQMITFLGRTHEIKNKFSLYR